jgi:hypothetical protein
MRSVCLLICSLVLLAVACGGGDDDSESGGGTAATPAATQSSSAQSDATTPSESSGGGSSGGGSGGVNIAKVTIGDRSFEFDVTPGLVQRCDPDFFGAFWVVGEGLDMLIAPADNPNHDPPHIQVTDPDDSDTEWWADSTINESLFQITVPEGQSQVDSSEVDGTTIRGTATFIEKSALIFGGDIPDSVPGTFEATCEE